MKIVNVTNVSNSLQAESARILGPQPTVVGNGIQSIGAPKFWDPENEEILAVSTADFTGEPTEPGHLTAYALLFVQDALALASSETSTEEGRLVGSNVDLTGVAKLPAGATLPLVNAPGYREAARVQFGVGAGSFECTGYIAAGYWEIDALPAAPGTETVRLGLRFHSLSASDTGVGSYFGGQGEGAPTSVREVLWPVKDFTAELNAARFKDVNLDGIPTRLVIVGLYEIPTKPEP